MRRGGAATVWKCGVGATTRAERGVEMSGHKLRHADNGG